MGESNDTLYLLKSICTAQILEPIGRLFFMPNDQIFMMPDILSWELQQAANYLSELEQSPSAYLLESLQPLFNVFAKPKLLKHPDGDVKLLVATCICEITRITAPEAPYNDDVLRVHSDAHQ